jgi:hypothetical protein
MKKQVKKESKPVEYTTEDVLKDIEVKLNMLKEAFTSSKNITGEITLEDIRYNIDYVLRILKHKFKK